MITEPAKIWLRQNYPGLVDRNNIVSGRVEFASTYNPVSGLFLNLKKGTVDNVGGLQLNGAFNIRIEERKIKPFSKLPALHVENIEYTTDRHFNQNDHSACLCSPLAEVEYLMPEFSFPKFFDELVIPFLYGQVFYSAENKWPWPDLTHGPLGLLESYFRIRDFSQAQECIVKLARQNNWVNIKQLLVQRSDINANMPCLCSSGDKFRKCHPDALRALQWLRLDVKLGKVTLLPQVADLA